MTSQHPTPALKLTQVTQTAEASQSPKILLVKLSSLGDVLHNLPIVWDLRKRLPHAQIDWPIPLGKQALLNAKDATGLTWYQAPKF